MTSRRRRRETDEVTAVIPVQTLDEVAAEWRAQLAQRNTNPNPEQTS